MPGAEKKAGRPVTVTKVPPPDAAAHVCTACRQSLLFVQTVAGEVQPVEHWDHYLCRRVWVGVRVSTPNTHAQADSPR
jgi:hypothetical protein